MFILHWHIDHFSYRKVYFLTHETMFILADSDGYLCTNNICSALSNPEDSVLRCIRTYFTFYSIVKHYINESLKMSQYFILSNFDASYLGSTFTNLTHAWLFRPGIVFQTYWKFIFKGQKIFIYLQLHHSNIGHD